MTKSAFRQALEDAIEQRHSAVHPWSEAWTSGKLDRRLLGEWVKQHFHYVSHFSEWLGAVYADCPHWDVQHPDGSHTNVDPDGNITHGDDNFPNKSRGGSGDSGDRKSVV